jgi:hypothetical protein
MSALPASLVRSAFGAVRPEQARRDWPEVPELFISVEPVAWRRVAARVSAIGIVAGGKVVRPRVRGHVTMIHSLQHFGMNESVPVSFG